MKKYQKNQKELAILTDMILCSTNAIKKLISSTNDISEKEIYLAMKKSFEELYHTYRQRIMQKLYKIYGQTPFDEKIEPGISLKEKTDKECLYEYYTLINMFNCCIWYLQSFPINTEDDARELEKIIKSYEKLYHKYRKKLKKKLDYNNI